MSAQPKKVFVSEDNMGTITCPGCMLTRQVSVASYCGKKNRIKVRCKCGHAFEVLLEFRQHHRKETDLAGFYDIDKETGGGNAKVKDVSLSGIGFTVSGVHNVKIGQKIQIEFVLDDSKHTTLKKTAVVKSVNDNRIGCEFHKDQAYEKDLGFFLSD